AFSHLEQELQRPPSAEEITKELDIAPNQVKAAMKNSGRHLSMDAPFKEGENDSNLYDVLSSGESPNPDDDLMQDSLSIEINRALDTLSAREADVIRLNYGIGNQPAMNLQEIGDTIDLCRERVRYIQENVHRRRQSV